MDLSENDGLVAHVYQSEHGEDLFVRPLHQVEDEAVIREIGDRELYLGNWRGADPSYHDRTFSYVLSATSRAHPLTTPSPSVE